MTDNTTNFIQKLKKGITLSHTERLSMRERLAAYTDMHPVMAASATPSPFTAFFSFMGSRRFSLYAGTLMAVIVIGSGVALAADTSAPGDSLYALKVNVNEPLMTAFAATPAAQAKVAADIATRRADEAVTLATRGTLTPDKATYLESQFTTRVAIAAKKADALESSGDVEDAQTVKANLEASLAGEAQALGATPDQGDGRKQFLKALLALNDMNTGVDDTGTSVTLAADTSEDASTTAPRIVTFAAKSAATSTASTTASTTPVRALVRFARLHLNASTTLEALLERKRLDTGEILTPKPDVAIPAGGASSASDETDTQTELAPEE